MTHATGISDCDQGWWIGRLELSVERESMSIRGPWPFNKGPEPVIWFLGWIIIRVIFGVLLVSQRAKMPSKYCNMFHLAWQARTTLRCSLMASAPEHSTSLDHSPKLASRLFIPFGCLLNCQSLITFHHMPGWVSCSTSHPNQWRGLTETKLSRPPNLFPIVRSWFKQPKHVMSRSPFFPFHCSPRCHHTTLGKAWPLKWLLKLTFDTSTHHPETYAPVVNGHCSSYC